MGSVFVIKKRCEIGGYEMYSVLKKELWKAKNNPFFWLALLAGILMVLIHAKEAMKLVQAAYYGNMEIREILQVPGFGNMDSCSLFLYWMPFTGYTLGSVLFYESWPLLAAIPFAWSYSQERRSGYYLQSISRGNKKHWYCAKFLAIFISGGVVTSVPLFVGLFVQALFAPAIPLKYEMMQVIGIINADFLAALFYTHPWLYCFCWCGVQFMLGGSVAVLAFVFGSKVRFITLAMLLPYALCYVLAAAGSALRSFVDVSFVTNVLHIAMPAPLARNPGWLIFSFIGIVTGVSYLAGYHQVMHHDLL